MKIFVSRFTKAFMTLFFALYTIGDSKDTLITPFNNDLTVGVGYILFCLFHIANITIMINMLIAMMTKSYENIIVRENNTIFNFNLESGKLNRVY